MSDVGALLQAGVPFAWAGAVTSISFIEAPLKFRAPGMTVPLALGIGRLVFPALNRLELVLACLLVVGGLAGPDRSVVAWLLIALPTAGLLAQMLWLRPRLDHRAQAVVAGVATGRASRLHLVYVLLEVVKLALLLVAGGVLVTGLLP